MDKKTCIICVGTPNGWYSAGVDRLKAKLMDVGFKGDFIGYKSMEEIGAPPHQHNPYAFKIHGIDKARADGYEVVLWCDASIYPVISVDPVFEWIDEKRYLMEEAGHWSGTWTNDRTLEYFSITRDEAMKIPMFSAGFMGLDFTCELVREFYARFKNACLAGMFKGAWQNKDNSESNDPRCKGHRHDMACASIIAHQLNMKYSKGGTFLAYIGKVYGTPKPETIFHLRPAL